MSSILKTLLDAIIGKTFNKNKSEVDYSIEDKDSEIVITIDKTHADQFQSALNTALSSAAAFKASLPYQIKTTKTTTPTSAPLTTTQQTHPTATPPDCTVSGAKQLLKNLFSEDAFSDLSIDLDKLFNDAAYVDDCVVFSKPSNNQGVAGVNNELAKYLLKHADGQPVERLRQAYEGNNPLPKPTETLDDANNNQKPFSAGLLEECFGTILKKNPTRSQLFFNMKKFYEFLYPPSVTKLTQKGQSSDDTKVTFTIKKDHFHQHVRALAQSEFLFRVYQNENEATKSQEISAVPLVFGKDQVQPKKKAILFLVDCSGSMEPVFKQVKDRLMESIEAFKSEEDLTIQITFFSNEIKPENSKTFSNSDIDKMKAFVDGVKTDTTTNLFGSIKDSLLKLLKENTSGEDQNVSVVLISDGDDTVSRNPELVKEAVNEYDTKKATLPKFIALGLGPDYNEKFLSRIAQITGGNYEHVGSMAKFLETLKSNNVAINTERDLVKFFIDTASGKFSGTLPINKGDIGRPDVRVVLPYKGEVKVSLSDNEYTLSVPDVNDVPSATMNDHLNEVGRKIRSIVRDEQSTGDTVLSACRSAQDSIARFKYASASDKAYADKLTQEINEYHTAFQSHDKFRISDARLKAGKTSGIAESTFEKKITQCIDGVCDQTAEQADNLMPKNPRGRSLLWIEDGEVKNLADGENQAKVNLQASVFDPDKSAGLPPLVLQPASINPGDNPLPSDLPKDTPQLSLPPSPQTSSASGRLEPPAILSMLALPFFVLFRGAKQFLHPDEQLRTKAEEFAQRFAGTVPPELFTPDEPVQPPEKPKPEEKVAEPSKPFGSVITKTAELPCVYPDGSNNVVTTVGEQPKNALMGACKLPKAPEPPELPKALPAPVAPLFTAATAQSISGGLVDGATTGFTYGFLSQLFQNQGMSQSLAQFAAEGAIAANIAQTSGYIPAAAYVALSHIPMEKILDGLGDLAEYVPQGASRAISAAGKLYVLRHR